MTAQIPTSARHPGRIIQEDWLDELDDAEAEFAHSIGLDIATLHALLTEQLSVTPPLAVALGRALNMPISYWLNRQHEYDLARTRSDPHGGQ